MDNSEYSTWGYAASRCVLSFDSLVLRVVCVCMKQPEAGLGVIAYVLGSRLGLTQKSVGKKCAAPDANARANAGANAGANAHVNARVIAFVDAVLLDPTPCTVHKRPSR